MEVRYHKDYRHNYLILKSMQTVAGSYQCRMLTGNEIKGLLPCKERHINGEQLFYYEITSKQSLASFYECGGITMELLCRLFVQLKTTWDVMSGFLLEERYLVLKPEFVFMDVETKEFSFLYYPEEPEEDHIILLLEFLIEKVDSEDSRAVDAVYKMMELAEREQFVIDEIVQWFEQDYDMTGKQEDGCKRELPYQDLRVSREEISYREEQICRNERIEAHVQEKRLFPEEYEQHPAGKIHTRHLLGNMVASAAVALGCGFVSLRFKLGERETVLLCAAFMASLAVLAFCVVQLFCKRFLPEKKGKESYDTEKSNSQKEYISPFSEEGTQTENIAYGNTVFIPWTESCENKLYGMGKGNKNHIDLNHLPLTVGKLAGSVDMVISEQSISRRHVKFARENGRICMTDLNSTNGTFKNGMRLLPNTSEILEPGDEIRLGKLKFIYR